MSDRRPVGGGSLSVSLAVDVSSPSPSSHLNYQRGVGRSSASLAIRYPQERRCALSQIRSWLFCGFPLSLAGNLQDLWVARRPQTAVASVVSSYATLTHLCSPQQTMCWPHSKTVDVLPAALDLDLCLQIGRFHPGADFSFVADFFGLHSLPEPLGLQQEEIRKP